MKKTLLSILVFVILVNVNVAQSPEVKSEKIKTVKPKVTFVELGSVNCIPCKQMVPVIKAIEENYSEQVKVIFYDVWTKEQKKYASDFKIKLIPTQVFLDENGKEFHRHEGFYPESEIDKILAAKGLKPKGK